jgi:dipeptidyl aminopeptidase/acylaminoacyl peptidase
MPDIPTSEHEDYHGRKARLMAIVSTSPKLMSRFFGPRVLACVVLLAFAPTVHAGEPDTVRPLITHEDIWLMKRVGDPVPSPDGRWIVLSVTDPSYDDKEQRSDLWIVPSDGTKPPRQLTFSLGGEGGIAWSPDGKKLAFAAKREGDEASQIYILNIAEGGEAIRFTTLSTGARMPQWRPDGKALLFVSSVHPGAADDEANKKIAAERKARKYKARVYTSFPIRNWDRWLEDMQPHLFVQTFEEGAKPKDILAGSAMVQEPGFSGRLGTSSEELDAVWSPDGNWIVFNATTKRNEAAFAFVDLRLYKVIASGGEPEAISPADGSYSGARFSPDGKLLLCSFSPTSDKVYNLTRIVRFNWPSTVVPEVLTRTFDRSVGSFGVTPDGRTIYLLAEEAGHEKLFSVPSTGGKVNLVYDMSEGVYSGLAVPRGGSDGNVFARWESASSPAEIVRIDLKTKQHVLLTRFNTEAAKKLNLPPLRHFWFTSSRGKNIHSMIVLPPGFDEGKSYPLVAMIHGGPHNMWRDYFFLRWNYHLLSQPGYVMLLTDYTGSTGYGEKFAQDIQGDPFVGPAAEIEQAVDEAIRWYKFIDGDRLAAIGASYGGHMVNWLQATTTRYKCFISHAGLINLESQWGTSDIIYHREVNNGGPVWEQGRVWREQNPIRRAENFRTPVLVTAGENDFRVPVNQALEYWSILQRLRVPSKLIVFPEENHWIQKGENSRFFYKEVHEWLDRHMK